MFRQAVSVTPPFTREMLNKMSDCDRMFDDYTLPMTATILLYNRVENFKLFSKCKTGIGSDAFIGNIDNNPAQYSIYWVQTNKNPDEYIVKANFENILSLQNIENFVKEKFGQTIYIRTMPKENTVLLCAEKLSLDIWHLLQSFISKYFEIFKEKPLNEKELELVRSLTMRTQTNYLNTLAELTSSDEFRTYCLNYQLRGFEKRLYERKMASVKENIMNLERELETLMNRYRDKTVQIFNEKVKYEGLSTMEGNIEEKTELQDYLISNKNLTDINIEDSRIRFLVKGYMIPYLTEDWENQSRRGYIFQGLRGEFESVDNARLLLDAVFSEKHCLNLRMCAYIDMDYLHPDVQSRPYDYSKVKNYIPNPHLQMHNCFGQNKPDIIEQLHMGDIIGAIECATHCIKHVNVNEVQATFKRFIENLVTFEGKCFVTEDNQELTPVEALHYLQERNRNESNSAE